MTQMKQNPSPWAFVSGLLFPLALFSVLFLTGCATLRPKGQIDSAVLKDLFCSGREAESREYLIQKGFKLPDVTERIERVRKECVR